MIVGRASGKRTLVEVMDLEMEGKRKKKREEDFISDISSTETRTLSDRSRFFDRSASTSTAWAAEGVAGPSGLTRQRVQKENIPLEDEYISEEDFALEEECGDLEEEVQEECNVAQEDGYISPSHSIRWDTPDLSSPHKPPAGKSRNEAEDDDFFATDAISSPIAGRSHSPLRHQDVNDVNTASSSMVPDAEEGPLGGVDLRDVFGDDEDNLTSDAEIQEVPPENSFSSTSSASTAGPVTPNDSGYALLDVEDIQADFDLDVEEEVARESKIRHEIVASGWWQKWACGPASEKSTGKRRVLCAFLVQVLICLLTCHVRPLLVSEERKPRLLRTEKRCNARNTSPTLSDRSSRASSPVLQRGHSVIGPGSQAGKASRSMR